MARPPKEARLRMDTDLRIPVTADQKRLIVEAIMDDPNGLAAWARQVLLHAAEERISLRVAGKSPRSKRSARPDHWKSSSSGDNNGR